MQFNSGRSLTIDNGSCEIGWRILLNGDCLLDHCLYPWVISISEGQVDVVDLWRTNWAKCNFDGNNSSGFNLSGCDSNSKEYTPPSVIIGNYDSYFSEIPKFSKFPKKYKIFIFS